MLIICVQNDASGTQHNASYDFSVNVNAGTIALGRVEGFDRDLGWKELVRRLIDGPESPSNDTAMNTQKVNWIDHTEAVIHGPKLEQELAELKDAMSWLTNLLYAAEGAVLLSLGENGDLGFWYPDSQDPAVCSGADVTELIANAMAAIDTRKQREP